MASMVIECPACGKPVRATTGLFSKKRARCSCGYEINFESERLATKACPHCGNEVYYDRAKNDSAICPICREPLNSGRMATISCPGCNNELKVNSAATTYTCPQCGIQINVQARIQQAEKAGKVNHIKWDMGQNDILIYRHPVEDFAIGSMLTVKEGQKAIFFRDGKGLDIFGPGAHVLETQNIPLLEGAYATRQKMYFSAQVYFIRTNRLDIRWGVPETEFRDPQLNFYVKMFSRGSATIQVQEDDSSIRKFLYMLMDTSDGTAPHAVGGGESYDISYIQNRVRKFIASRFSDMITQIIIENGINILDMNYKKAQVAKLLCPKLNAILEDYGLTIPNEELFLIETIGYADSPQIQQWKKQEADRNLRVREQEVLKAEAEAIQGRILIEEETEAKRKILRTQGAGEEIKITAAADSEAMKLKAAGTAEEVRLPGLAEADVMHAKDYTYQQETSRELGKEMFKNGLPGTGESSGNLAGGMGSVVGEMAGLGIGLAAMGSVMNMAKDTMKPITEEMSGLTGGTTSGPNIQGAWSCSTCGTKDITSNFCPNCGAKKPMPEAGWTCPSCGKTGITSNFCPDCGTKKGV